MNTFANISPDMMTGVFILLCCGCATKSFQTFVNIIVIIFSIVSIFIII